MQKRASKYCISVINFRKIIENI